MKTGHIALAGIAVVAVMAGVWSAMGPRTVDERLRACGADGVAGASIGGPFEMIRHDGVRVDQTVLNGAPTLMYFGFTFCPDVCPTSLSILSDALDLLDERGLSLDGQLVTVDPERDTPEVLAEYVSHFHPRIGGLTGSQEDVERMAKAWRVYHARAESEDFADGYTMDHSSFTYLHDADGAFVTFFRHGTPADKIADFAACYFG